MIDTTDANALADEVLKAEEFRRKHTARSMEIARRYVGNWYRQDAAAAPTPENLIASYVTFMLPELSYAEPGVRIIPRRPITHKQIAEFVEMAFESWMGDAGFGDDHGEVVRDMLMGFGVMKVGMEPRDTYVESGQKYTTGDALVPFACRVPPDQIIIDPRCESPKYARLTGHCYWKDLNDLEAEPDRWDQVAVEALRAHVENGDDQSDNGRTMQERPLPTPMAGYARQRVGLVDLWIPETGELVTLGRAGTETLNVILRRVPFYGPKTGPYQFFGCYSVPGDPYPIGPLQFAMEQFEEMQAHIVSASDAAATYKRFCLVDAANGDLHQSILQVGNGQVVAVRGANAQSVAQIELGGPNAEQLVYIQQLRDRFDRIIGAGDAQRGKVSGVTATESQIAQQNTDGRVQWVKSQTTKATRRVLEKVLWYLFKSPNVVMTVSWTDPLTGQAGEGLYLGGEQPGQDVAEPEDFRVEIVPDSMARTDDQVQQARALQLLQIAPQALQMMLTMPQINARFLIDMLGDSMNIQNLTDQLFNQQLLGLTGQLAGQQAQFGGMGMPQGLPEDVNPSLIQAGMGFPVPGTGSRPPGGAPANAGGAPQRQLSQGPAQAAPAFSGV